MTARGQEAIDLGNAEFWDELCGTTLAQRVGVSDASAESLARFDAAYLEMYPYLDGYLPPKLSGQPVLEIGLGFGTLGQRISERSADYHGLDIADGPVAMMRHRLALLGIEDADRRVVRGSALEIPHPDSLFSAVVSVGCLHHTGDLRKAVSEVHRVLRPGGTAMVMLYNAHSLRQLGLAARRRLRGRGAREEEVRAIYDANVAGEAAPFTQFVSKRDARGLFDDFASVRIRPENFDDYSVRGTLHFRRTWFLGNLARVVGLDLYITAVK